MGKILFLLFLVLGLTMVTIANSNVASLIVKESKFALQILGLATSVLVSVYVCVFVCVCIYVYVYIHVCIYISIYMQFWDWLRLCSCRYIYMYICAYICVYMCRCMYRWHTYAILALVTSVLVSVYLCVYICMYNTYVYVYIHRFWDWLHLCWCRYVYICMTIYLQFWDRQFLCRHELFLVLFFYNCSYYE